MPVRTRKRPVNVPSWNALDREDAECLTAELIEDVLSGPPEMPSLSEDDESADAAIDYALDVKDWASALATKAEALKFRLALLAMW